MGSIEIFANDLFTDITLWGLFLLFLTAIYCSYNLNLNRAIWYLFAGLFVELIGSWYGYNISYNASAVTISMSVALELTFILISVVLLALAAAEILTGKAPVLAYAVGGMVLGMAAIIFFCFIYPDGEMINNMRKIFPIAGFAYLMASFWSQATAQQQTGYWVAATTITITTIFLLMRLFNIEYFVEHTWYISLFTYVSLIMSLMMIKNGYAYKKVESLEGEIEKYNRRLEEIIKSSPFPIVISRLSDDKILMANDNAVKLFGILPSELDRYRLKDFFADGDNRQILNERLEKEKEVHDFEVLAKAVNGETPFWLLTSANVIDYNYDVALYCSFQDITSRKNREAVLKNQATRDPLTSLFNRRYFEDEVNRRIALAQANHQQYSVLMIDADHFKRVNDTYGHKTGDKVLIELSSTAEKSLRQDDIVARYGGEEFVVFLPELSAEAAKIVADRLRETISKIVVYSDQGDEVRFTVSIGISSSAISDNIDTLIKTSDEALYRAKENGRNRCEIFTVEDLKNFNATLDHKDESSNHHPIFDKENTQEISLLDGVDTNHIVDNQTKIEEQTSKQPQTHVQTTVSQVVPQAPQPQSQPQPSFVQVAPAQAQVQTTVSQAVSQPSQIQPQAQPQSQPSVVQTASVSSQPQVQPNAIPQPSQVQPQAQPNTMPQAPSIPENSYPILGVDNDELK